MTGVYGSAYYTYQRRIGQIGGWANRQKFLQFIRKDDRVLDFGCGGGFLLDHIDARQKFGVEPNASARAEHSMDITSFASAAEVPDQSVDVVISNHALEHCEFPLGELRQLFRVLVPGGRIVVVVPTEAVGHRFVKGDPNHHLYSWSPMALGNILESAGFEVVSSEALLHRWPPSPSSWARLGPKPFHAASRIYGFLSRTVSQARAVASRPMKP